MEFEVSTEQGKRVETEFKWSLDAKREVKRSLNGVWIGKES